MIGTEWRLAYVLPNFTLEPLATPRAQERGLGLETHDIAIVAAHDPRLAEIRAASSGANTLLSAFIDQFGMPYQPAALVVRDDASIRQYPWESAIVSYRTAVAMAVLLRATAHEISIGTGRGWLYSDAFQFHPTTVADNGIGLLTIAPSMASGNPRPDKHVAMPSPYLPLGPRPLLADAYLWRVLTREWERRYLLPGEDDVFGRALFRSLDVAYQASAAPLRHGGTMHEYGAILSNWVSAIEILVWPKDGHADEDRVLAFLRASQWWLDARLTSPTFPVVRRKKGKRRKEQMTPLEGVCAWLYRARNDFLHGNRVARRLFFPVTSAPAMSLMDFAPLIYYAVLAAYLAPRYPSYRTRSPDEDTGDELLEANTYEQAFLKLLGLREKITFVAT
jgi:hypothetical protein